MTEEKKPVAGPCCKGEDVLFEWHSCPYAEEIGNNYSTEYCTCCPDCEKQCVWDI